MGQLRTIAVLDGSNYTEWKNSMDLNLALLDFDLYLREDPPEEIQPPEELNMAEEDYEQLRWN